MDGYLKMDNNIGETLFDVGVFAALLGLWFCSVFMIAVNIVVFLVYFIFLSVITYVLYTVVMEGEE